MASRSQVIPPAQIGSAPPLREEVGDALERLARILMQGASGPRSDEAARVRETVRLLGQVASGWSQVTEESLPASGAGYGSTVVVEDVDTGAVDTYTLMAGALLDFDAGQVSLASPIGRALVGVQAGDAVEVDTPQRHRRLRVLSVRTLRDLLDEALAETDQV